MAVADWTVVAIVAIVVGLAAGYIIYGKYKGNGCIGCPDSKDCSKCKKGCFENKRN